MKNALFFVALSSMFFGNIALATDASDSKGTKDLIETGYAAPGSAMHSWAQRAVAKGINSDVGFSYEFHVVGRGKQPASIAEMISSYRPSNKNFVLVDIPPQPGYLPGGVPSTSSMNDSCTRIDGFGDMYYGSVTVTWSYQYTTDLNNDGTNESDPDWVITGISFSGLEHWTSGQPIPC